ncbi:TIR-like protein FxsC [Kitasatospora sp. NPDC051853]|uniref:TIR-like protein FxsC n=1 Tax=Kitasatospora sp. NPDC051853 TaxID=3364058 RepID=UPI0037AC4DA1
MYDEESGGWDEGAERPYFFLSYAHVPRARTKGAGDPNQWVSQLYEDLCEAVLALTDYRSGRPVGFMDQSMHQGQLWAKRLSQELATCRVFVPLYSPRYFSSLACGQEWHSFTQRPVFPARQTSERTSGIVPVLWVPMSDRQLPEVARQLQFNHRGFGREYEDEGLYALMRLGYFRKAYELAVFRLARRIVEVAENTVIPPGRALDFNAQPSAFPMPRTKQLRISVYSYAQSELPEGRNPDYYGTRRQDWHPYQPASSRPVAEHAARVARQLGFEPTVHEFEEDEAGLLSGEPPNAPGLVLLDRWALKDDERRGAVARFDQLNPPWVSVLEPWNAEDPDCVAEDRPLTELSARTLRYKRREAKPSFRDGSGELSSLADFEEALPRAVMRAKYAFEDRTAAESGPAGRPGDSGRFRPRLRGAFDDDPPRDRGRPSYDPHDEPPDDEEEGPLPGRFGGGHR